MSDFRTALPRHVTPQREALAWLASAHAQAAAAGADDEPKQRARFERLIARYGCDASLIDARGHELDDTRFARLEDMPIASGARGGLSPRMDAFAEAASRAMEALVPEGAPPPHLLHVTCTGYVAPSAAQALVARRGWGRTTTVTHVYHSGCYAAFPAVRIAAGLAASGPARIAHTEACTLHVDVRRHEPEQLVLQGLFADGHVSYLVTAEPPPGRSLGVVALREEILPDSGHCMTWRPEDASFAMTLSRDVPERIADGLPGLLERLAEDAGLAFNRVRPEAIFVVHPGGPRILDVVQDTLGLSDAQLAVSRDVLRRHGNMSSSTIPHCWRDVLADEAAPGRLVVSCAFGPGLTASAGIFRVHEEPA